MPGVAVHTCAPSRQEAEARGLRLDQSRLQSEFKDSPDCTVRCVSQKTKRIIITVIIITQSSFIPFFNFDIHAAYLS